MLCDFHFNIILFSWLVHLIRICTNLLLQLAYCRRFYGSVYPWSGEKNIKLKKFLLGNLTWQRFLMKENCDNNKEIKITRFFLLKFTCVLFEVLSLSVFLFFCVCFYTAKIRFLLTISFPQKNVWRAQCF